MAKRPRKLRPAKPIDAWERDALTRLTDIDRETLKPAHRASVRHRKGAMLLALRKTLGIVTQACEITGIGRETHYRWMRTDKTYAGLVEDLGDLSLDFAESRLLAQIGAGEVASTIFYLKTKGRGRGYVERKEVDVTTLGDKITAPPIAWSDEE